MGCEYASDCGFYKKYADSKDAQHQDIIERYCRGKEKNDCKRLAFKIVFGQFPNDRMMPSGYTVMAS